MSSWQRKPKERMTEAVFKKEYLGSLLSVVMTLMLPCATPNLPRKLKPPELLCLSLQLRRVEHLCLLVTPQSSLQTVNTDDEGNCQRAQLAEAVMSQFHSEKQPSGVAKFISEHKVFPGFTIPKQRGDTLG